MEKRLPRARLWARLGVRAALLGAAAVLLGRFGRGVLDLTTPFLLGWGMAVLLDPAVTFLAKRLRLPRNLTALLVVLGLLVLAGGGVFLLVCYAGRELMDLGRNWDVVFGTVQTALDSVELLFARMFAIVPPELTAALDAALNEVLLWLEESIPTALKRLGGQATDMVMELPSFLFGALVFVMGTYFLTADYPSLCSRAARNVGEGTVRFFRQVRSTALVAFGGYLKAQAVLSFGVFCILLLGFLITGQEYGVVLALALAVLDFIPLLGAGTVMIPWAVIALVSRNYESAISVMVIWGVIALYRRTAEPKIVGDKTGLSPVLSLFSIYAGMKLAGVTGMILGPILALVLVNLARNGMFRGLAEDLRGAAGAVSALLERPEGRG